MHIETERLIITEFDISMAESVYKNSLDEDTRRFLPDEVFESVEKLWSKKDIRKIMDLNQFKWTREPASYSVTSDKIEIITKPHTDLWQRTYYHFRYLVEM